MAGGLVHQQAPHLHLASMEAGALVLPVASHDGFSVGSQITIDPGTKVQEVNYITGFGSFLLKYPLRYPHAVWMKVVVSAAAPPAPAPGPVQPGFSIQPGWVPGPLMPAPAPAPGPGGPAGPAGPAGAPGPALSLAP